MAINPAIPVNGDDLDADPIRANFAAAAALETDYNAHKANVSNPHSTTAAQVGADPAGTAAAAVSAHTGAGNPHSQYALTSSLGTGAFATIENYLPLAGGTMTGALNWSATQTIASDTTTDIGAATSNSVIVSGTTTITALGTIAAGAERVVQFSGALTLTHNATSLILPGAASITTAAGDVAYFISLGSGNWRCTGYQKANGQPVAGGGGGGGGGTVTGSALATLIHGAAEKTALVDDDEVAGVDSEESYGLIRSKWSAIKTFLQTYFDGRYSRNGLIAASQLTMPTAKLLGRASAGTGAVEYFALAGGAKIENNTLFPIVDQFVDLLSVLSSASGGSGNYTVGTNWIARGACAVSGARVLWSPPYAATLRVDLFRVVSGTTLTLLASVTAGVSAGPTTVLMTFSSPITLATGEIIYIMVYETSGTRYTARIGSSTVYGTYRIGALVSANMGCWWTGGSAPFDVGGISTASEIYPIEPVVSA